MWSLKESPRKRTSQGGVPCISWCHMAHVLYLTERETEWGWRFVRRPFLSSPSKSGQRYSNIISGPKYCEKNIKAAVETIAAAKACEWGEGKGGHVCRHTVRAFVFQQWLGQTTLSWWFGLLAWGI